MKKNILSGLKIVFFLSLGLGFIWLFTQQLSDQDKSDIWQSLKSADYTWIAISMVIGTLSHISRAIRWKQLMEPMDLHPSTRNTFFAVMVMYFANLAIPRIGEVTRCAILRRYEGVPMEKSFGTVVGERAIDFLLLGIVVLVALLFQLDVFMDGLASVQAMGANSADTNEKTFPWLRILFLAGFAGIIALFFLRKHPKVTALYNKIRALIIGFIAGLRAALQVKRPVSFIAHSLFIWFMYFFMIFICFYAMPETAQLPWGAALSLLVFGSVGIILVPGGIGIYPLIIAKILTLYGVSEVSGYAFGWIVWIGQTLLLIVWGTVSLILLPILNKKISTHESSAPTQTV